MGISLDEEIALIEKITGPGPGDVILDLACGPGLYARALAAGHPERTVIGLDLSWPMLRYGAVKARRLAIENLAFVRGDAHILPLKDGSVDVADCCGALHLFTDVPRVLGELARVVRPGGRLAIAAAWRSEHRLAQCKADLDERFWRLHYFRTGELEALLRRAGFTPAVHHAKGLWIIAGGVREP
jgi:ubiquinone/menaquinone biosynthesis C-methylase UbiE